MNYLNILKTMNDNKYLLFSVIVTTYNRKELLKETMDSILAQTYSNFELIVVDNYSNYDFIKYMESFNDDRIRPFQNQNNGVIAVNRNYGINKAKGEYIAFCDDDDTWFPNKLEVVYSYIIKSPDSILFCHYENMIGDVKKEKVLKHGPYSAEMYKSLLFNGNKVSTSATVVRKKETLEENGFDESKEYLSVEDYDLWMRLAKRGSFVFIEDVLGNYYWFGNNISANSRIHTEASFAVVDKHLKNWLIKNPNDTLIVNKTYSIKWFQKALAYNKLGDFRNSKEFAFKAIKYKTLNIKAWVIYFFSIIRFRY